MEVETVKIRVLCVCNVCVVSISICPFVYVVCVRQSVFHTGGSVLLSIGTWQGVRQGGTLFTGQGQGLADVQSVFLCLCIFIIAVIIFFRLALAGGGVARQRRRWGHRGRSRVTETLGSVRVMRLVEVGIWEGFSQGHVTS